MIRSCRGLGVWYRRVLMEKKLVKRKDVSESLSCLEKRKNELAFQETHCWNNTLYVDFLDSNSTNYNKGNLAYL